MLGPIYVVPVGADTDSDPILNKIGEGIMGAIRANDAEARLDWMDALAELQEHRAVACVAARWN